MESLLVEALPPLADVELLGTGDPLVAALVEGVRVVHTHHVDAPRLADNHRQTRHTYTIKAQLWQGRV